MTQRKFLRLIFARWLRHSWIGIVALILLTLALLVDHRAWAAPHGQTVPPVPTSTSTPVPQATNTPRPDDEEEEEQPPATAAPGQPVDGALTGEITVARLNMRLGPSTTFDVIGALVRGQTVRILERNEAGSWWRVCCLPDSTTEGWASAQYIRPHFDAAQANTLIPVAGSAPTPAPTTPVSAGSAITPTVATSTVTTPSLALELLMTQTPAYVWQGQEFSLDYAVTNLGSLPATEVELRNELPVAFTFVSAEPGAEGLFEELSDDPQQFIFRVGWPSLAAGATVTATVRLRVAEDIPDSAVIDNLAVVAAENAAPFTAGISVGMPPTAPPDFQ